MFITINGSFKELRMNTVKARTQDDPKHPKQFQLIIHMPQQDAHVQGTYPKDNEGLLTALRDATKLGIHTIELCHNMMDISEL